MSFPAKCLGFIAAHDQEGALKRKVAPPSAPSSRNRGSRGVATPIATLRLFGDGQRPGTEVKRLCGFIMQEAIVIRELSRHSEKPFLALNVSWDIPARVS